MTSNDRRAGQPHCGRPASPEERLITWPRKTQKGVRRDAASYGERTPDGAARFACAACGDLAALVRLVRAGAAVDAGPPIGEQVHQADGVVIDGFPGSCWQETDGPTWTRIQEIFTASRPDPGALHAINWELAPFWCRRCHRSYCNRHWDRIMIMDEGFYDYTDGWCPAGHRQMLDD
jgi:hypothetical protein